MPVRVRYGVNLLKRFILNVGEQERDAAISHGASAFLRERLMLASDAYETVYCKTCGTIATTLALGSGYACRLCKTEANFGRLTIPYVYKYLTHLLNGMGMFMSFKLATENEFRNLRNVQTGQAELVEDMDAEEIERIKKEEEEEPEEDEDILGTLEGEELRKAKFKVEEDIEQDTEYDE